MCARFAAALVGARGNRQDRRLCRKYSDASGDLCNRGFRPVGCAVGTSRRPDQLRAGRVFRALGAYSVAPRDGRLPHAILALLLAGMAFAIAAGAALGLLDATLGRSLSRNGHHFFPADINRRPHQRDRLHSWAGWSGARSCCRRVSPQVRPFVPFVVGTWRFPAISSGVSRTHRVARAVRCARSR